MSALSIHPIEYLRLHVHYEGLWTKVLRSLGSLFKKVFASSEQAATITVFLLTVGLVIASCVKIAQAAAIAASYDTAISEIVFPLFPPLQAIPPVM